MAKNDTLLIDGILDDRIEIKFPSDKRDEVFEFFAIEQILKDNNFANDEILSGIVDGQNDGGIDAIYIMINGHLFTDPESFTLPKTSVDLTIHLITCKHHDTFKQATFDNLSATLLDFFDLNRDRAELEKTYNKEVLNKRDFLKFAYRKISPRLSNFFIQISYASRGDTSLVGESVSDRGTQIKKTCRNFFSGCDVQVEFYGSSELISLHRKKPNFSLELPFVEVINEQGEQYVVLTTLSAYYKFISDEKGKLRRYLFDSNVRDFMGFNRVNEEIKNTLKNESSPNFWWLNNGVTILATKAVINVGKVLHIEDIQIVNGLQTTESIHKHFQNGGTDIKNRSVLVKIIASTQAEVRDSIIRATNNQTTVELSALHATDKIQRDIEDILQRFGLYYERRTNYYFNQGIPPSQIISPIYLAAGFLSLCLKNISKASNLKSRLMRSPTSYKMIFSDRTQLDVWPVIGQILRKTDTRLEKFRINESGNTEHYLKKWRHTLSYLAVSRLLTKFDFTSNELIKLNINEYNDQLISETWNFIKGINESILNKGRSVGLKGILSTFQEAAKHYNIPGLENIESRLNDPNTRDIDKRVKHSKSSTNQSIKLAPGFIEKVEKALPAQPWKPGMHLILITELSCSQEELSAAINFLIRKNKIYKQKDGVLFNKDGGVIAFDPDRVDAETLSLKEMKSNT